MDEPKRKVVEALLSAEQEKLDRIKAPGRYFASARPRDDRCRRNGKRTIDLGGDANVQAHDRC